MRSVLVVLFVLAAAAADAAPDGQGAASPPQPRPDPDFLFGPPAVSAGIRGAWLFARAGSEWYDFVTGPDQLTIDRGDFDAPGIAGEVGIAVGSRLDAIAGVEFTRAAVRSEYRRLVDNDRLPIEQDTTLAQVNLTGSLKVALRNRGREISRFAWVPNGFVPYVGAGGGALWYRLRQSGDFVDVLDPRLGIFTDVFESSGWAPAAHVFGGVEVKLTRRLFATFDARYLWGAATMSRQFQNFDKLDLAGFRTSAGVNLVF